MDFLQRHIEVLIFCTPTPLSKGEIVKCLSELFEADIPDDHVNQAIVELMDKYQSEEFSFQLEHSGGGYQFLTKPAYQTSVGILLRQQSHKRLSTAQMETLSIIAYKQPVTKGDIEQIRGVNSDYSVQKLLEKELVDIKGKSEGIGRPILYGTSTKFMEYFGINKLSELPQPKDFSQPDNQIGEERE